MDSSINYSSIFKEDFLKGYNILITGASSGIGMITSRLASYYGARVRGTLINMGEWYA